MSETPADALLVERRSDGVAVLTLNDPDRRNAMSDELTAAWKRIIAELRADTGLRCVVVTGAGSAFSSGGDLSWLADTGAVAVPPLRDRMLGFYRTWLAIRDLEVPTIAAVNGHAVGAACASRWPATCGTRRTTPSCSPRSPRSACTPAWPRPGCSPRSPGCRWPARCCWPDASSPAPGGRAGPGQPGLPARGVLAETIGVAERIAGQAPIATRLTKVALSNGGHPDMESALRWESLAQPVTMSSRDMLEGSPRSARSAARISPATKAGHADHVLCRVCGNPRRTVKNIGVDLR